MSKYSIYKIKAERYTDEDGRKHWARSELDVVREREATESEILKDLIDVADGLGMVTLQFTIDGIDVISYKDNKPLFTAVRHG